MWVSGSNESWYSFLRVKIILFYGSSIVSYYFTRHDQHLIKNHALGFGNYSKPVFLLIVGNPDATDCLIAQHVFLPFLAAAGRFVMDAIGYQCVIKLYGENKSCIFNRMCRNKSDVD